MKLEARGDVSETSHLFAECFHLALRQLFAFVELLDPLVQLLRKWLFVHFCVFLGRVAAVCSVIYTAPRGILVVSTAHKTQTAADKRCAMNRRMYLWLAASFDLAELQWAEGRDLVCRQSVPPWTWIYVKPNAMKRCASGCDFQSKSPSEHDAIKLRIVPVLIVCLKLMADSGWMIRLISPFLCGGFNSVGEAKLKSHVLMLCSQSTRWWKKYIFLTFYTIRTKLFPRDTFFCDRVLIILIGKMPDKFPISN